MKSTTALARHCPHRISLCFVLGLVLSSCAPSIPLPIAAKVDVADYVLVTSTPRSPPVEFIPPRPRKDAVWVDGSWDWASNRYGWLSGTWAVVPEGLRRARWVTVRRKEDGQLFFAPASWKDATGKTVDDTPWIHALGPEARARTRIGGPPPTDEPPARAREPRQRERKPEDTATPPPVREEETPVGSELR